MTSAATSPKTRRKEKQLPVRFDEREATVLEFKPCEEDPSFLWFSKQEIVELRNEGRALLKRVQKAGGDSSVLDESEGECFRGLEHGLNNNSEEQCCSPDAAAEDLPLGRSQRRKNIINVVLAQQQETRDLGLEDPKGLQVTATSQTKWAKNRALTQGEKDFEAACQIWMEDKKCSMLLPSMIGPQKIHQVLTGDVKADTPEQRRDTLELVSSTISSALAELDDMDELDF